MARQLSRHRPRGKARLTQWVGPADQAFVNVATGGSTLVALVSFEEALTVIRNRGGFAHKPQAYSSDLTYAGAVGMGIVTAEAFAIGITAIPTPFSDADWGGWMVWRSFAQQNELQGTAANVIFPAAVVMEIDSKAMRKVTPNEVLVIIAESQSGAFALSAGIRTLVKLS